MLTGNRPILLSYSAGDNTIELPVKPEPADEDSTKNGMLDQVGTGAAAKDDDDVFKLIAEEDGSIISILPSFQLISLTTMNLS